MTESTFDAIDPMEATLAVRVRAWTDQVVEPIDAGGIARAATTVPTAIGPLGRLRGGRIASGSFVEDGPRRRSRPILALALLALLALVGSGLSLVAGQRSSVSSLSVDSTTGFVTEVVEPGVLRIVNDGIRDLAWTVTDMPYGGFEGAIAVGADGGVWMKQGASASAVFELGGRTTDAPSNNWWHDVAVDGEGRLWVVEWDPWAYPWSDSTLWVLEDHGWSAQDARSVRQVETLADGSVWSLSLAVPRQPSGWDDPAGQATVARLEDGEWSVQGTVDGVRQARGWTDMAVSDAGDVWVGLGRMRGDGLVGDLTGGLAGDQFRVGITPAGTSGCARVPSASSATTRRPARSTGTTRPTVCPPCTPS